MIPSGLGEFIMCNPALAVLAALALSGCASATRGWSENITVSTTPSKRSRPVS
jgi:hypothetical protein